MFSVIVTIVVTKVDIGYELAQDDFRGLMIAFFACMLILLIGGLLVIKEKKDKGTKEFVVMSYYAFVAVVAGISLKHHASFSGALTFIERMNLLLIWA